MMRRMKAGACVQDIDRQRPGIRGQDLAVLGDGTGRPLVGLGGVDVDAPAHGRLPGLAPVPGAVDAPAQDAVLQFAGDGAVEHGVAAGIGASGEALDLQPRQPLGLLRPGLPAIVAAPDAFICSGEHAVFVGRASPHDIRGERGHSPYAEKMKAEHAALRTRAEGPRDTRIVRQEAPAAARADEHEVRVGGVDCDLAGEGILEIANGSEGPAAVAADL
jgi:hypothetical protein